MKKNQENTIVESPKTNLPVRPKSLRPIPSLSATKSLKPRLAVIRPLKIAKGPVVG